MVGGGSYYVTHTYNFRKFAIVDFEHEGRKPNSGHVRAFESQTHPLWTAKKKTRHIYQDLNNQSALKHLDRNVVPTTPRFYPGETKPLSKQKKKLAAIEK